MGTELRVFAYVQNGVLVATFLGLGLGARSARDRIQLLPALVAMLVLVFAAKDPLGWEIGEGITQGLAAFGNSRIWYQDGFLQSGGYLRTAILYFATTCTLILLVACAYAFRPLGQWLGRWMDACPRPIAAYSANILGSIVGIGSFVALTAAGTPPFAWFAIAGIGLALLSPLSEESRLRRALAAGLALALPFLSVDPPHTTTFWSPYQKLALLPLQVQSRSGQPATCGEQLTVNNALYQSLLDLDIAARPNTPLPYTPQEILTSHYRLPHYLAGPRASVLIVGAGAGNDAAGALRGSAERIHAVEIDPTIVEIGRKRHPNRPYDSPRVRVTVDDARAVFRNDRDHYDLVWLGLLDSHTALSGYTNIRLDHYVYTRESFAELKARLNPTGVVALLFSVQDNWLGDRLARLLQETFGTTPLAFNPPSTETACIGYGATLLVGGSAEALAPVAARALAEPAVRALMITLDQDAMRRVAPTTDDWPYLYLERPAVPGFHLFIGLSGLVIGVFLRRALFKPGEPAHVPMMLLGAAFMLFEVTGVSRAALLFGTTWAVNAYMIGAILSMILLANLVASRWPIPAAGWPFIGLGVSLLLQIVVPIAWFAALPLWLRVIVGGGFLALPVFFSGLVFATVWAAADRKDLAFGSNLLGSLIGGAASMLSMAIGFEALLWLTLATYLAAQLSLGRVGGARARHAAG